MKVKAGDVVFVPVTVTDVSPAGICSITVKSTRATALALTSDLQPLRLQCPIGGECPGNGDCVDGGDLCPVDETTGRRP